MKNGITPVFVRLFIGSFFIFLCLNSTMFGQGSTYKDHKFEETIYFDPSEHNVNGYKLKIKVKGNYTTFGGPNILHLAKAEKVGTKIYFNGRWYNESELEQSDVNQIRVGVINYEYDVYQLYHKYCTVKVKNAIDFGVGGTREWNEAFPGISAETAKKLYKEGFQTKNFRLSNYDLQYGFMGLENYFERKEAEKKRAEEEQKRAEEELANQQANQNASDSVINDESKEDSQSKNTSSTPEFNPVDTYDDPFWDNTSPGLQKGTSNNPAATWGHFGSEENYRAYESAREETVNEIANTLGQGLTTLFDDMERRKEEKRRRERERWEREKREKERKERLRIQNIRKSEKYKEIQALKGAIKNKNFEGAEYLIKSKWIDVKFHDDFGNTALHHVVIQNWKDGIKSIIEKGGNINAKNDKGETSLHIAIRYKSLGMVKELLKYKPDLTLRDKEANTVLHSLMKLKAENDVERKEIIVERIRLLLDHGIEINLRGGENGGTILHEAINTKNIKIAKLCIESGANVNLKEYKWSYDTPLHSAVEVRSAYLIQLLIKNGADPKIKSGRGWTAIKHARKRKSTSLVPLLKEKVNSKEKSQLSQSKVEKNIKGTTFTPTLGIMPDYVAKNIEGLRIDAVIHGRPAEKAGMQKGDIIIQIGSQTVNNINDYVVGLGKCKVGDTVKVLVKRDQKIMELDVTF
jgi:ankyrin repeat protein